MLTGTYLPGATLIHRASPVVKVAVLAALMVALVVGAGAGPVVAAGLFVVILYAVARVPPRVAAAQVWPLRWLVGLLFAFQTWALGWAAALVICANLVVAVAAASVLTLTTRVDDLRRALVAGLHRLPLPAAAPERIGLAVALMIRSIPVITAIAAETRDARRARGLERSIRAFVTPTVVRTIRHAQGVGEALQARGVDD